MLENEETQYMTALYPNGTAKWTHSLAQNYVMSGDPSMDVTNSVVYFRPLCHECQ